MSDSEEEILVFVDFNETVPQPTDGSTIKIIGLETESPIVQCQKQTFRGEWKDCLGTKILLRENKNPEPMDPAFSPNVPKQFEYACSTSKVLQLQQYVLKPKVKHEKNEEDSDDSMDVTENS